METRSRTESAASKTDKRPLRSGPAGHFGWKETKGYRPEYPFHYRLFSARCEADVEMTLTLSVRIQIVQPAGEARQPRARVLHPLVVGVA
jgi:hypothetical protein